MFQHLNNTVTRNEFGMNKIPIKDKDINADVKSKME